MSQFRSTDKAGNDSRASKYKHSMGTYKPVTETSVPGQNDVKGPGKGK